MLDPEKSIYRNFLDVALRCADRAALTFLDGRLEPRTYNYSQLFTRAEQIACGFDEHRLPRHAPVGILLGNQEDQVLHYLAALARRFTPAILTPPNRKLNR